ncbi:ABCA7 [Symbiodinium microadriaticum]|nr:ABCA7 [Symbiodinium microadriaticum]
MSVVGDPPIVFMDEPTTGLDPGNKAHVWKIIQTLKTPERLILMTTHSMEEAEALCSRIGIMARGELQCIGSAHHLKSKFGKGYALTINLVDSTSSTNDDELSSFVTGVLSGGQGVLLSSINKTRKFLIPKTASVHVSHIFKEMELNKSRLGVREWGLAMSTLEDVFISTVT